MSYKFPIFTTGNAWIRKALNAVAEYSRAHGVNPAGRTGWSETPDGWMPPPFHEVEEELKTWDLIIEDASAGEVSVNIGTIIKKASDLTDEFTISGGTSTFTPAANQWLYLKIADITTPTVTLTAGGNWTDYPSAVEITSSGASAAYAAYYYPLYHFRSTAAKGYAAINETLFYRKLAQDDDFLLIHSIYQAGSDRPVTCHMLIPYHRALP